MFIVQNGCRPWLEGNPYVDEEGSDEELEEGYFDEQYSKEGEPTVAELWEARHDDDHYFTFNHEEDMDMSPCGDTESTQICFSEDFQSAVPFLEFVERHGCRVDVADEEFSPSEGERIRFTAAFREEQRGRAVFSGGCVEKRNEFSVEVPKKAGEDLDYSRLQFFVHRVWSNNIHHYTDYIMGDIGYDDETYEDCWECDCSEEAWHDITPVESHVSYRFVAGACINRWAKGVLARRRARLLRVWRTVLRGSTRVADRATGDPTAAEEVGAAEADKAAARQPKRVVRLDEHLTLGQRRVEHLERVEEHGCARHERVCANVQRPLVEGDIAVVDGVGGAARRALATAPAARVRAVLHPVHV